MENIAKPIATEAALVTISSASWYLGDLDTALSANERAGEISRLLEGPDHPVYAGHLRDQAGMLIDRGDYQEAVRRAQHSEDIYGRALSEDAPPIAAAARYYRIMAMAYLEVEQGRALGAEALARDTVRVLEQRKDQEQAAYTAQPALATVLQVHGRCAEALPILEHLESLLAASASIASDEWDRAENQEHLGACLLATGAPARARTVLEQSVKWFADNGTRNLVRAEGQFLLAQAKWATGAKGEARLDGEEARALLAQVGPRGRKMVPEVDRWLAEHRE
jgi:ATP/maltotriose-dependent transcriptional regulator MalT